MSLLSAPPVACPEGPAAYGLPAVPPIQSLDAHFARVLARRLHADADADADAPEQIALNLALILAQDAELDASQMGTSTAEAITAEVIAGEAIAAEVRAGAAPAETMRARAALDSDIAAATPAARAALTAAAVLRVRADSSRPDAIVLDARLAPDAAGIPGMHDAVGNVQQQIQTAKALRAAAKARAQGSAAPAAMTQAAAPQGSHLADATRAMTPTPEAHAQPAHDALASLSASAWADSPARTASSPPPPPAAIPVALAHPQWAQSLGQHVLHLARASTHEPQTAHLRLDPPELGPLRIAIQLHEQVVQASFVSAHAPVRLAVETALSQLQEQLAHAGLSLGQTSVSDQDAAPHDSPEHARPRAAFALESAPASTTPEPSTRPARASHALIDTFV